MKKTFLLLFCLMLTCGLAFSQHKDKRLKAKKLSKAEAANLTQEQRIAHEQNRKSDGGRKKLTTKQKARIQRKQNRAARHTKGPTQ